MVLVDTSVFIDYLKNKINPHTEKFEYIQEHNILFGINSFIYQEILQGALTDKEFKILKEYFSTQKFYTLKKGNESCEAAAYNYFKCRKAGITVRSTIDMLIVQTALENNLFLLHNDSDFTNIAGIIKELKIY